MKFKAGNTAANETVKMPSIEDICRHEISHAFAIWLFGGCIDRVTVSGPIRDSDKLRTPHFVKFKNKSFSELQDHIFIKLMAAMAAVASDEQRGNKISDASLNDVREALDLLSWSDTKVEDMAETAHSLKDNDWKTAALGFFEKYGLKIKKIIARPLAQKAMAAAAKKLLDEGNLTGQEVAALFEKAWKGLPGQAQPVKYHTGNLENKSLVDTIKGLGLMVKINLNLLRKYCAKNSAEEEVVDKIALKLIDALLEINEAFRRL